MRPAVVGVVVGGTMISLGAAPLGGQTAPGERMGAAESRIEEHRKADATVVVVDAGGQPVRDANVTIQQTRHAFLFGCNIFQWGRAGNDADESAYRQRFAAVMNYATLPFYWPSYERQPGQPDHERTGRIAAWCQQQGIATKGHPLAWNYADPPWLPDDLDRIRQLQMKRIDDCVGRFAGRIDRWDVVNEAAHFERESFLQRAPKMTRMWQKAGRLELVRDCFQHARQANPDATLLINDYRVDEKYDEVLRQMLDANGKRIYDVIGIQSHMHRGVWSDEKIWEVCERFAKYGVPLHFTETTILSGEPGWSEPRRARVWPSTEEGEQRQARETARFYTLLFSHPAVEAITWWDFSDRRAWQGAPAGWLREDMSPKPVYHRLLDLIRNKWWTQLELKTDARGRARFRGFLGNHDVVVSGEGQRVMRHLTIERGKANELVFVIP
jgi:GH35 family endo-1,4-beta-xylanase